MTRLLMPLILIGAAIGLFVVYTNTAYQSTKGLSAQVKEYDDALNKSKDIKSQRDSLVKKRSAFAEDNVKKLSELLPDNVDNIRLIIDINNIAARHQLSLKDVQLGTLSDGKNKGALTTGASGDAVGSVDVGFTITADYDTMLAFVADLEHSLRLIDIQKLSFGVTPGSSQSDFAFTIRTYWLH